MSEDLTCCELINNAQNMLTQILYNIPSTPEQASIYLCAANSGLKAGQTGLLELSKKTCDQSCCEAASNAIVQITTLYFSLLDQINNATDDIQLRKRYYQFYLTLLREEIDRIVCSVKNPFKCCIESNRAIAIFQFEDQTFQDRFDNSSALISLRKVCQIIQQGFDSLYKVKISLECLCQLAEDLITLQNQAINLINETSIPMLIRTFGQGNLENPTGIAIRGNLAYVSDNLNNRINVFNKNTGVFLGFFGPTSYNAITIDGTLAYAVNLNPNSIDVYDLALDPINPGAPILTFGVGTLNSPTGIAVRGSFVYVSDFTNGQVEVFDMTGTPVGNFGSGGYNAITIDGNLAYVANTFLNVVEVYNLSVNPINPGAPILTFGNGILGSPRGLSVRGSLVYVADVNEISTFDKNTGTFRGSFGSGTYNAITIDGNLAYISNRLQPARIEVFNLDVETLINIQLNFLKAVVKQLTDPCQVSQKSDCCVSPLLVNIYSQYSLTNLAIDPQFRKFTACVYKELQALQQNKIKQTECCEVSFNAIQQAYSSAIIRFGAIIGSGLEDSESQIFQAGQVILKQIHQIIETLLSNKCKSKCDKSSKSSKSS